MLVKKAQTKRLDIPHENGEWVEIRRLSWLELEEAGQVQAKRTMGLLQSMGADVAQSLRSAEGTGPERRDITKMYDRATVLHAGVVAWSYDEDPTPEVIDTLDQLTADWLFRQIVGQHDAEAAQEKKADSKRSSEH